MLQTGKLLVSRGVDHGFISGAWRRIDISAVSAQEVRRIFSQAVGEIHCVRGSWSWPTGDELAYIKRMVHETGVDDSVTGRVVEWRAHNITFDDGDQLIVVTDVGGKVAFTLYAAHPWGPLLRSRCRKRRCAKKKYVWLGELED